MSVDSPTPQPGHLPLRDRRQSKRYITLRNAKWAVLGAIVLLVVVSLYQEFRPRKEGNYGRLYEKRKASEVVSPARKPLSVIPEGSISDETAPDPMLVQSGAREKYLGVDPVTQPVTSTLSPETTTVASSPGGATIITPSGKPLLGQGQKRRIRISGGADGIALEVKKP